ncbi:DTX3L ligase, partial [Nesospiza acunhae]|nr:DTX3L ligase [Nesospiza acunhae]
RGKTLQPLFKMSYSCSKVGDPRPGHPYKGGNFCAFLPESTEGLNIAKLLKRAFECGLTFQIKSCNGEERVTWGPIPHKTSWDGGKARNGYPDARYLHEVGTVL